MNAASKYVRVLLGLALICNAPTIATSKPLDAAAGTEAAADHQFSLQQWVRITDGRLEGMVQRPWTSFDPVENVQIRVISIADATTKHSSVRKGGRFEVTGLSPGAHILVATGEGYYASFAIHLMDDGRPGIPSMIEVPLARADAVEMRQFARKHIPVKLAGNEPTQPLFSEGGVPVNATVSGRPTISINREGAITGRLWVPAVGQSPRKPATGMTVAMLADNALLAIATSDAEGRFTLNGMVPGMFTLAAAGDCGFLAFGVELAREDELPQVRLAAGKSSAGSVGARKPPRDAREFRRKMCPTVCCEVLPLWEVVHVTDITSWFPRLRFHDALDVG